ncbi:hypothetical protein niasHS_007946 [Heterodera schachtii]|uniref:Hexosyltransferase n=1 Tax=Heterodera schachtii TaxID=97005 RepID=A0ABD2JQ95_HETSC
MFPGEHFPPFLYGGCYLTTPSTIKAVLEQAHKTDSFYLEDVLYTGILAELANVTVSDQLSHFYGNGLQFECVDRLPTPFAVWNTDNGNETVRYYEELKKMSCEH